jgi:hypothetical protein
MVTITIGRSSYIRHVGKIASIFLRNRFFEQNPVLNADQEFVSLISRPTLRKFMEVGDGPIRSRFDEPGTFEDATFVASGTSLYKITTAGVSTLVGSIGSNILGSLSWAAVGNIGETPERLFFTDGGVLWVYTDDGEALGHLEATGAIANTDVVEIGGTYYRWTNASVDAGTPAGTVGNPWLVALGAGNVFALENLFNAINATGIPGTDYSTVLVINEDVQAYSKAANDLFVAARVAGITGNAITTTETGANIAWAAATLQDGGDPMLRQVPMPDDVGAISVDVLNSYVAVIPVQGQGANGQFWWIEPGETRVDPLNFATAERSPDAINQVRVFSDRAWMLGQKTTEPWVTTGNLDAPWQRFSGVLYDRGSWEGTAVKVKDSLITVDEDGAVFQLSGGLKRISRPDIEERIRKAIQREV